MYDLISDIKQINGFDSAAINSNTTTNGVIVDTQGFESLSFILNASVYTDGVYNIKVETSNDSGLANPVDITSIDPKKVFSFDSEVIDGANKSKAYGVVEHDRYVRFSVVSTSVTTGATLNGLALLGNPKSSPARG